MQFKLVVLSVAVLAVVAVGCGEEGAVGSTELSGGAEQFAQRTGELQRDVRQKARHLLEDPMARRDARKHLKRAEAKAREVADRIERELPKDATLRNSLMRANERTAQAARALRRSTRANRRKALSRARRALRYARRNLGNAADLLSPEARRRLDELDLPDVSQPAS